MRKILRLVRREYLASVRTKGFIIGLMLAPIIMGGSIIAMVLFEGHVDTTDRNVAVVDRSGVVVEALVEAAKVRNAEEVYDKETGEKVMPAYLIEIIEPNELDAAAQRLELSNRVRSKQIHAFVEIGESVLHPRDDPEASRIAYYAESAAMDEMRSWIAGPINKQLRQLRLADAGVDESAVSDLFDWLPVEGMGLVSVDKETGKVKEAERSSEAEAFIVPFVMLMLMFLMFMMGAMPLLNAVMEEKSQRIAEVILGSVQPFQFMMGKLLGGVFVALTGAAVYVIGGILAVRYMGMEAYIPYHVLPWFFVYMLAAILMMGAIYTALGSACNSSAEAQSLSLPAMLPLLIPIFVALPVLEEPLSTFATGLSLFPPFTPMLMLLRLSMPAGIPMWQPWVGLVGVVLFTVFSVWVGGRIFRVGILMQGAPLKLSNIFRWAFRG